MNISAYTLGDKPSSHNSSYARKTKPSANVDDRMIGLRMLTAREEIGMSRLEIADILKVTQQQVEKYEKGHNRISAKNLFLLSKLLGKTMNWFVQDIDSQDIDTIFKRYTDNRVSIRIIKRLATIKDKTTQDKIMRIIKIITKQK